MCIAEDLSLTTASRRAYIYDMLAEFAIMANKCGDLHTALVLQALVTAHEAKSYMNSASQPVESEIVK